MNLNAINNNSLEAILDSVFQNSDYANSTGNVVNTTETTSTTVSDNSHLSPFARLASFLQQLQQSNQSEYESVTQEIAANLQAAAQTDQTDGDTAGAQQLSQLSTDFTNASTTGQLPDLQDLAQALGGDTASPKITISLSQLEQLLASFQAHSGQDRSQNVNESQNPMSIILNTLTKAGYNISSSSSSSN